MKISHKQGTITLKAETADDGFQLGRFSKKKIPAVVHRGTKCVIYTEPSDHLDPIQQKLNKLEELCPIFSIDKRPFLMWAVDVGPTTHYSETLLKALEDAINWLENTDADQV